MANESRGITAASGVAPSGAYLDGTNDVRYVKVNPNDELMVDIASFSGDVNVDNTSTSTTGIIGKVSGGDFTTAYASGTTVTCAGLPTYHITLIDSDIVAIEQIDSVTGAILNTYTRDDMPMLVAANVITVTGATFGATDLFVVYTNVDRVEAYDVTQDVMKDIEQSPARDWYTDPIAYTAFAPDTIAYEEGGVISTKGFHTLNFAFSKTVSTQDNSYIKIVYLSTSGATVDYQECYLGNPIAGVILPVKLVYELDKAVDAGSILSFPTKGYPFMRIDVAKVTDIGTDAVFTTEINKVWGI